MTSATSPAPRERNILSTEQTLENRLNACCYDSIRETARQLDFSAGTPPGIDALNRLAAGVHPAVTTSNGRPVHFIAQPSGPAILGYEAHIYATGAVPTRPGKLHDIFNALVWLTFPHSKAALNRCHISAQSDYGKSGNRTRLQDALTLFDECAVIVASDRPDLLALIRDFQWKTLFWQQRDELKQHVKFFLFGHGLMEQLLNPYVGLTSKAFLITIDQAWLEAAPDLALGHIDRRCSERIAEMDKLSPSRDLLPLPVLGIPGWSRDNEAESYYDNLEYFRPSRRAVRTRSA